MKLSASPININREVRIVLVYFANEYLGERATLVGELMGISQAAASMLKRRDETCLKKVI